MLEYNLEYYRAFYYTVKLGGFTRAAQALCVSQSAVSQSVGKLEKYLGCSLLIRKGRHTEITPEGELLYESVAKSFELLCGAEQKLLHSSQYRAGTIRISASETPLHMVLLPALGIFREQYPDILIRISGGGSSRECAQELDRGEVDIAMGVSPLFAPKNAALYHSIPVESVAVRKPDRSAPFDHSLTGKEFSEQKIICADRGSSARAQLEEWFDEEGVFFTPVYSVKTSSMILALARQGLGTGIIPAKLAEADLARGDLELVPLTRQLPERNIQIAAGKHLENSRIVELFLEYLLTNEF